MWTKSQVLLLTALALFLGSEAVADSRKSIGILTPGVVQFLAKVDPALNGICKKTDYPKVCVSTIQGLLKGQKVDPVSALKAEIQAATVGLRKAKGLVDNLIAKATTSKEMNDTLSFCSNQYDQGLDSLQTSLNSLNGHDRGTLETMLGSFLTFVETCNDAFAESPKLKSPVSLMASELRKIGSNCLVIAEQVRM